MSYNFSSLLITNGETMHEINVSASGAFCTCGWSHKSLTGSEAQRVGEVHARKNTPAMVVDLRFIKKED